METYDLVLALIANEPEGQVLGRTLLQKKLYFLNELISGPIHFYPHYYGPYSREVTETVDSLVSASILNERAESFPAFVTPWGESTRYSYEIPIKIRKQIEKILPKEVGPEQYEKITRNIAKINEHSETKNYKLLSIAAKVLQILKRRGKLSVSEFPLEAKKLKWKLTEKQVSNAGAFLENLGLLNKSSND